MFPDNSPGLMIFTRLYFYQTLTSTLSPFACRRRPTAVQSNYTAIQPRANQTFNSLMVPHSVIGLCSETNKQSSSRLVIPPTATHAESTELAANKRTQTTKKWGGEKEPPPHNASLMVACTSPGTSVCLRKGSRRLWEEELAQERRRRLHNCFVIPL